jgi:O-succinylhomoserine sulfhydrylase
MAETKSGPEPAGASWRRQTQLVRGGTERSRFLETSEGLFLTSGYVYETAEDAERAFKGEIERYIYSRFSNPTVTMFENRMALLEGAEVCRATASGMAAVFASLICQLNAGDHVVASRALFGSCLYVVADVLPRYGIEVTIVDGTVPEQWEKALSRETKCVFLESPSNPALEIIDLGRVGELTHAAGGKLIVDNVFATPVLQHPLEFGADIVIYSATKHIDGQGRVLGGVILCDGEFFEENLRMFLRHTGPSMSPFNAWVLLKGLETLDLRVRQHCRNTHEVVRFLAAAKGLERVLFPGLESHPQYDLAKAQMEDSGNVVAFEIEGGKEAAFKFLNALKLIDMSNNLGDAKSLITHPATTTHQRLREDERAHLGITPGLVRLSVGLEDPEDVIEDLDQALAAARR